MEAYEFMNVGFYVNTLQKIGHKKSDGGHHVADWCGGPTGRPEAAMARAVAGIHEGLFASMEPIKYLGFNPKYC